MKDDDHALEFIKTDVRTCGLLVADPTKSNSFKFAHKSFMEYLFADVLSKKTLMELIEEKFHLTCDFKDRGNVLRYHGNDKNAYENCSVKRADLKKAIKVLSEWKI